MTFEDFSTSTVEANCPARSGLSRAFG